MTDAEKLDLINAIIADYFEFVDAEKDANGILIAIGSVASYGRETKTDDE